MNLNFNLNMPLADMVSTFEQRIKGSYMPAPKLAPPIDDRPRRRCLSAHHVI